MGIFYLNAARVQAKKTQQETADALGVSRNTVASWESYTTKPSMEMGQKIASFYGMSVDDIKWSAE